MYINDIHILYYLLIAIVGMGVGQFIDWCNIRLESYKKVFSKEFVTLYLPHLKLKYSFMAVIAIVYLVLLYQFGWNLQLLEYMILTPMLLSVFVIDMRKQIIPNRLTLSMLEVGMVFTFIQGMTSINIAMDRVMGMVVGAGIFLLITLIGGMIAGKEAMGFGDVKFMGALGLFFGWTNIIIISILSFLTGAVISIILLISRRKKGSEYIPFGPFIVIATLLVIFIPSKLLMGILFKIFTLGLYQG